MSLLPLGEGDLNRLDCIREAQAALELAWEDYYQNVQYENDRPASQVTGLEELQEAIKRAVEA